MTASSNERVVVALVFITTAGYVVAAWLHESWLLAALIPTYPVALHVLAATAWPHRTAVYTAALPVVGDALVEDCVFCGRTTLTPRAKTFSVQVRNESARTRPLCATCTRQDDRDSPAAAGHGNQGEVGE